MCETPYFPLYTEKDREPAAYYFTGRKVILPAGLNKLKEKIYEEWSRLEWQEGADSHKAINYPSASNEQMRELYSYLSQMVGPDGTVKEPGLGFLAGADYMLFRDDGQWKQYKFLFRRPCDFKGYSLPVWSCSLEDGKESLDGWADLYQKYGLFPSDTDIRLWLHGLVETSTARLTKEQYSELKKWFCKTDYLRLGNENYGLSEKTLDDGR